MMALLLQASWRSLALATVVLLLITLFRVHHPKVRKVAWAAVLAIAFFMPLLGGHLVHVEGHGFGVKPWPLIAGSRGTTQRTETDGPLGNKGLSILLKGTGFQRSEGKPSRVLAGLYLIGAGLLLLRFCIGLGKVALIWQRSQPFDAGFGSRVRLSEEVSTPWTFGNGILLPVNATEWSATKLDLVLAHERMHIEQADFFLQSAVRLYTAFFWFSPLGWLLQKECARLGEQTSDYAALRGVPDPLTYAEVLIGFSGERFPVGAVSMARSSEISQRIQFILKEGEFMTRFASPLRASLLTAAILPAALLVSTLSPRVEAAAKRSQEAISSDGGTAARADDVDGFAATIADHTPIVGLRKGSGSQVSSGSLTFARVGAIEAKLDTSFIAFSENGQDYVITDPKTVEEAMGFFSSSRSRSGQSSIVKPAATSATALEAEQQREIERLKRQLHDLKSPPDSAANTMTKAQHADIVHKLESLIAVAKQAGQVSLVSL